ncbi:hypothetical protein [Rubellicoccus peritrichatus]|uniref:Uncharacterized protein n=1 Tax=Rubellicoccus peritrichatus TaxID=3080537 RepID=A0AAQ3QY19_9BACT|nr:hypothetical protein [Puniceicoccus sp. CR14]WOO43380.1 hypothetical protein RZN69_09795 [Puniceicoccus sp. CR14]
MANQNAGIEKSKLPKHLKIVSWAFIFLGFLALIETIYSLLNSPVFYINFFIVFIFVGFALIKKKELWRKFAISCSAVVLIFMIGNVLIVLSGKKTLSDLSAEIQITFWIQAILGIGASAYALWALQSKEVRKAFES